MAACAKEHALARLGAQLLERERGRMQRDGEALRRRIDVMEMHRDLRAVVAADGTHAAELLHEQRLDPATALGHRGVAAGLTAQTATRSADVPTRAVDGAIDDRLIEPGISRRLGGRELGGAGC